VLIGVYLLRVCIGGYLLRVCIGGYLLRVCIGGYLLRVCIGGYLLRVCIVGYLLRVCIGGYLLRLRATGSCIGSLNGAVCRLSFEMEAGTISVPLQPSPYLQSGDAAHRLLCLAVAVAH
jgi:hypothetical protein